MSSVDIGKTISYVTLETALVKAAEEVGLRAKVKDFHKTRYKLGSVEESQEYHHTEMKLRGRVLPAMVVYFSDRNPTSNFGLWTGLPHGFASRKKVRQYLNAVSRNL